MCVAVLVVVVRVCCSGLCVVVCFNWCCADCGCVCVYCVVVCLVWGVSELLGVCCWCVVVVVLCLGVCV